MSNTSEKKIHELENIQIVNFTNLHVAYSSLDQYEVFFSIWLSPGNLCILQI